MFITVRVALQQYTTEECAKRIGRAIASQVKDGIGNLAAAPVEKVHVIVDEGMHAIEGVGNCVGP